jgi:hypothetical protein
MYHPRGSASIRAGVIPRGQASVGLGGRSKALGMYGYFHNATPLSIFPSGPRDGYFCANWDVNI